MRTRSATHTGQPLWAVPYPQVLNDIPMVIARQTTIARSALPTSVSTRIVLPSV